jgi:hypothetical protein
VRRLPLALLLALVFLGAFTVMQHYSARTYDAEAVVVVSGAHGCSVEHHVDVSYWCAGFACPADRCYFNYVEGAAALRAEIRGEYTASRVKYGELYEHLSDRPVANYSGRAFRVYLCRGASAAAELSLPPPEGHHGLLGQAEARAYVYARMGRVAAAPELGDDWAFRYEFSEAYHWYDYYIYAVERPGALTCEGQQRDFLKWTSWNWRFVGMNNIVRVADALYVFVRLDQPASLVEVETAHPRWGLQRVSAAVPEGGPDLSQVVALYPVAIRQEEGGAASIQYDELLGAYRHSYEQARSRYYIQLLAELENGSAAVIEVPADAAVSARAWDSPRRVVLRDSSIASDPAGDPVGAAAVELSPAACADWKCDPARVAWRIQDDLRLAAETPPVAPRGGTLALPVGRRALLFVLAWPATNYTVADRPASYAVTVRVKGIRPRLVR